MANRRTRNPKPPVGDAIPTEFAGDGQISTEFTWWCGLCSVWQQFPSFNETKTQVTHQARRYGWRHTKAHGWVCRKH